MPKRGENIYKRKDNRWEGRYIKERTFNNKPKYGYVYATTYREVKEKLEKAKQQIKEQETSVLNINDKEQKVFFNTISEEWLLAIQLHVKESTTIKYYNLLHSYILPVLGEVEMRQITKKQIENLSYELLTIGGKRKKGLSPKTVSDVMSIIKNIFKFAAQKDIVCRRF